MPFKDTNTALGLPRKASFQVGRSNVDTETPLIEQGVGLPWVPDPAVSWIYYDCTVGVMLDSGIVVHNRLPQVNNLPDTLASAVLDDPTLDKVTSGGVNLNCQDQYTDIVQRMGHARYWFRLWGQALRVGHRVPIPGIKVIGGVPAIPYDRNPQWAYNTILPSGNYGGVVIWRGVWSLWYTTAVPPRGNYPTPAVDLAAHVSGATPLPTEMQAPYSQPDDNAEVTAPPAARQIVNPKGVGR